MFGLFDQFNTDDPAKQAKLAQSLALLEAGGPSRTPVSLFQGLGMAGRAGMEAKKKAQEDAYRKTMQDMQLQQLTMQQEEAKRRQGQQQQMSDLWKSSMTPGGPGMPANEMDSGMDMGQQAPSFDRQKFIQGLGNIDPMEAFKLTQPKEDEFVVVGGNLVNKRTGAVKFAEAPKPEKPPEPLRILELIHGKGTPAYFKAAEALGNKMTRMPGSGGGAAAPSDVGDEQSALTKRFGKASAGYRWTATGGLEPIPGGPADQKSQAQSSGRETVDTVIAGLRSSYDSLDKGGGITSTEAGTAANLGRWAARSPVGQAIGSATGSTNQKERDSIAQARPLLLQAIMKATGMSAKQMDSNAELKLYLATATDPTLSLQANREALDRIEQLYGSGAGAQVKKGGGATGDFGAPKPQSLSPEDAQAREWATKNPNDPRAKQIMQRLGGG